MDIASLDLLAFDVPSAEDVGKYAFEAQGLFSLTDSKTCHLPRRTDPCPPACNKQLLLIESREPLSVVGFDDWQKDNPNETCDYLIFNSGNVKEQFAFCELTCSKEQYVNPREDVQGKRAKAYSQMVETWRQISESDNPIFRAQVLNYVKKIGLFGWRDRSSVSNGVAMRSPRIFTQTPSSKAGITRFPNYIFGENFNFIQVKYPHVFHWGMRSSMPGDEETTTGS